MIRSKLTVNHDRFPNAQSRLAYLTSRLEGPAYSQILPYIKDGKIKLTDYPDALAILNRAFGDPNRTNNARKELFALRQTNKEFGQFFAEFHRLALEADMHEDALPTLLEAAISRELRDQLISVEAPTDDYHRLAKFLQNLDNRRRYYQNLTPSSAIRTPASPVKNTNYQSSKESSTPRTDPLNTRPTFGEPITVDNVKGRKVSKPSVREFCVKNNLCFYCKEPAGPNHNSRNCPHKPTKIREFVVEDDA